MKRILYFARGRPGTGHLTPLLAIAEKLRGTFEQKFLSYDYGIKLLEKCDFNYEDIQGPFESDSPYPGMDFGDLELKARMQIQEFKPDLVICHGELMVPALCNLMKINCISIISPQYVLQENSEYKNFGQTISFFLNQSGMVIANGRFFGDKSNIHNTFFVNPLLREIKHSRNSVLKKLGLPNNARIILLSTGGGDKHKTIEKNYAVKIMRVTKQIVNAFKDLKKQENNLFLVIQDVYNQNIQGKNIIAFNVSTNLIDLLQVADVVIGKAGLSFMYECAYYAKTAALFYLEDDWEFKRNALFAEQNNIAIALNADNLQFTAMHLKRLLGNPPISFKFLNGVDEAILLIEKFLEKEEIKKKRPLVEIHQYCAIYNEDKKILIINSNKGLKKQVLPGGTLEDNEGAFESLAREVKEETNIILKNAIPFCTKLLPNFSPPIYAVIYFAHLPSKVKIKLSHEHSNFEWVHPKDLNLEEARIPELKEVALKGLELFIKTN